MFIDTHCHPYLQKKKNLQDILSNFTQAGGKYLVSVGVDIETSKKSINLAKNHDFIRASVGIHPCDIGSESELEKQISELEELIINNKKYVVAIGETGLDYFHKDSQDIKKTQALYFKAQITLAEKLNLPIIIHNRDSKDDVLAILKETGFQNFIFHCYSENYEYAQKLLKHSPDCKLSFSGIVTFKNALEIQDTAQSIPLKNILVETDAPYLTPVPYRGKEENEPAYTQYSLDKIIELRNESENDIKERIYKNSLEIFGL